MWEQRLPGPCWDQGRDELHGIHHWSTEDGEALPSPFSRCCTGFHGLLQCSQPWSVWGFSQRAKFSVMMPSDDGQGEQLPVLGCCLHHHVIPGRTPWDSVLCQK